MPGPVPRKPLPAQDSLPAAKHMPKFLAVVPSLAR
jgi:hypothetical protein